MANATKRLFSMTLKKRVTLFGCFLIILQLMLFNYTANMEKKAAVFATHESQVQLG